MYNIDTLRCAYVIEGPVFQENSFRVELSPPNSSRIRARFHRKLDCDELHVTEVKVEGQFTQGQPRGSASRGELDDNWSASGVRRKIRAAETDVELNEAINRNKTG